MPFFNDNPVHTHRRKNRVKYLDDCLKQFVDQANSLNILYDPKIAELIATVYWDIVIPILKKAMYDPNGRIDHHKIISGTQCAIMVGSFLRTDKTAIIPLQTREAKDNPDIRKVNAVFACYIAYDILEQWNNIDITPLHNRNIFGREHVAWLQNVAVLNDTGKTTFPFFAISQLWYLAEELCKASSL